MYKTNYARGSALNACPKTRARFQSDTIFGCVFLSSADPQ